MSLIKVAEKTPAGVTYTRSPTLGGVVSGVSEIVFGLGFVITWVNPNILGTVWLSFALEMMLLEFILIHSSPFMGVFAAGSQSPKKRVLGFLGLGAFYSLFVLGFCLSLKTWRPMVSFWIVTGQRLLANIFDPKPTEEAKAWMMNGIAMSAISYLLFVPLTLFLPFPRLGITDALESTLGLTGDGAWERDPYRVVILAAMYYLLRGWLTATARPRTTGAVPKQ